MYLYYLQNCNNIIFGKERSLKYQNCKTDDIKVRYFTNVEGVVLYVENTCISYSKVQTVQNYKSRNMSGFINSFM